DASTGGDPRSRKQSCPLNASLLSVDGDVSLLDLFPLDGVVDFLAVDGNLFRRFDAQTHLVTADLDHHNGDVVTDDDLFVLLAAEYQHCFSLQSAKTWRNVLINFNSTKHKR